MEKRKKTRVVLLGCLLVPALFYLAGCPPNTYRIYQILRGEVDPWQLHSAEFRNLCTSTLCPPGSPGCMGSEDYFELEANSGHARDRFVFFEGCQDCSDTSLFIDGEEADHTYRTGGAYAYFEGEGSVKRLPLSRSGYAPPVAHIRRYDRGICAASDTLSDTPDREGLRTRVETKFKEMIEEVAEIDSAEVMESHVHVYLGSEDCGHKNAADRDFFDAYLRMKIDPHYGSGHFYFDTHLTWRMVAGPRSEYLDCEPGKACEKSDRFVPCVLDDDCEHIPGATCNSALEGGVCGNEFTLDIKDHAMWVSIENHCGTPPGDWECRETRRGFEEKIREVQSDRYRQIFVEILRGIEEEMFDDLPDENQPAGGCVEDEDCSNPIMEAGNLVLRCSDEGKCQGRPSHIYGLNIYPDEFEVVLARTISDVEYLVFSSMDTDLEESEMYCHPGESMARTWYHTQWLE